MRKLRARFGAQFSQVFRTITYDNEIEFADLQRVEDWINTLPRKILGYETPQERFDAALKTLHT